MTKFAAVICGLVLLLGTLQANAARGLPSNFIYSPYKDVAVSMDWNTYTISTVVTGASTRLVDTLPANSAAANPKLVSLAFATGECGSELWGGVAPAAIRQNIDTFLANGVYYIVSTGGAAGSFKCSDDTAFTKFIDFYNSKNMVGIDFDIEGGMADSDIDALVDRVLNAQASYPNLRFSWTLATLGLPPAGQGVSQANLGYYGKKVMASIQAKGLTGYYINLMTMDYGASGCTLSNGQCDMAESAINAVKDLQQVYGVPFDHIEMTPMIGGQDVREETFTLADAEKVAIWAASTPIGGLHFWAFDRDKDCPPGWSSPTCNTYGQAGTLGFSKKFILSLGGSTPVMAGGVKPKFGAYKDVAVSFDSNNRLIASAVTGTQRPLLDVLPSYQDVVSLAFATGECGSEAWGGISASTIQNNIQRFFDRQQKYIISTGGASGTFTCGSDSGFNTFVSRYMSDYLVGIDFDIETAGSKNAVPQLVQRVKAAMATYPKLRFSWTVSTLGQPAQEAAQFGGNLGQNGRYVLEQLDAAGIKGSQYMNLMAMDYGEWGCTKVPGTRTCHMFESAKNAAISLHDYFGISYDKIAITPMIGGNDVQVEQFATWDAYWLAEWAVNTGVSGLHYWSFDRDRDCPPGTAQPDCNTYFGTAGTLGFSASFNAGLRSANVTIQAGCDVNVNVRPGKGPLESKLKGSLPIPGLDVADSLAKGMKPAFAGLTGVNLDQLTASVLPNGKTLKNDAMARIRGSLPLGALGGGKQ